MKIYLKKGHRSNVLNDLSQLHTGLHPLVDDTGDIHNSSVDSATQGLLLTALLGSVGKIREQVVGSHLTSHLRVLLVIGVTFVVLALRISIKGEALVVHNAVLYVVLRQEVETYANLEVARGLVDLLHLAIARVVVIGIGVEFLEQMEGGLFAGTIGRAVPVAPIILAVRP